MPSVRIHKELNDRMYFVTFTIKNWYYIFDRHNRFQILEDCFVYCQKQKALKVFAFVFMLNHLHFIGSAHNLGDVIRDMKGFLSKEIKKNIIATEPNILKIFEKDGKYTLWEKTNYPKLIKNEEFFKQKVEYVQYNPVRKQYVLYPEDWKWSSASKIQTRIHISSI